MNALCLSRAWPNLEALFEDDVLLAINKPDGLLVTPHRSAVVPHEFIE